MLMPELEKMPRELEILFSGKGFSERHGCALPLVTVDASGYPRAALLSFGQVRAHSGKRLSVAVRARSHTAANLMRRPQAMLYYLTRHSCVFVQVKAGRARACASDPGRQIFPLSVFRVKTDLPGPEEEGIAILTGALFSGAEPERLFSPRLFEELGKSRAL